MSTAQSSGAYTPGASSTRAAGTTEVAREQVSEVGQSAGGAAAHVAKHSKEQVGEVAAEAQRQARDLLEEARTQVSQQAGTQRDRLTEALMSVGSELQEMADKGSQGSVASEVARQASSRIVAMAGHIEGREPVDLLDELRSVARRRPAAFLVGAFGRWGGGRPAHARGQGRELQLVDRSVPARRWHGHHAGAGRVRGWHVRLPLCRAGGASGGPADPGRSADCPGRGRSRHRPGRSPGRRRAGAGVGTADRGRVRAPRGWATVTVADTGSGGSGPYPDVGATDEGRPDVQERSVGELLGC